MSDFFSGKINDGINISSKREIKDEFSNSKSEYKRYREKMKNSDFAASPVALKEELKMLDKLKTSAQEKDKTSELEWIDKRISEINIALSEPKGKDIPSVPYYRPLTGYSPKQTVSFSGVSETDYKNELKDFLNPDGTYVDNAEPIVNVLKSVDTTPYQAKVILSRCKNTDDKISAPMVGVVNNLVEAEFSPVSMAEYIEDFSSFDDKSGERYIADDVLSDMRFMKSAGMKENSIIKFSKMLKSGFEDKVSVLHSLKKLNRAKINDAEITELLNVLAIKNENGEKTINQSAVNSVVSLKNALVRTQNNESAERKNPLSKLGERVLEDDVCFIFTKDGKYLYSLDKEDNSPEEVKKRYLEAVADAENGFLIEFAKKYKQDDGSVDTDALRVAVALRNAGVTLPNIFELTDRCIQSGEIDTDMLDTVTKMKKAGALSEDISLLLDNVQRNDDGTVEAKSLKDICDLTEALIVAENTVKLLSEVKENKELKDSVISLNDFLEDKRILAELVDLCTDENGKIDTNSVETIYYLFSNSVNNYGGKYSENDIKETAKEVLSSAQNPQTKEMSDDSTGIVSILTHNGRNFEEIKSAIDLCKNSDGIVDEKLSQILWDLGIQNADFNEMKSFLNLCKNDNGSIKTDNADLIISLFQSGFKKEQISGLLFG